MSFKPAAGPRLFVFAVSLLASGVAVWAVLRWNASRPGAGVVGIGNEVRELYRRRHRWNSTRPPKPGESGFPAPLRREPIDEATAALLFPPIGRGYVYDPKVYFRRPSNLASPVELPEFPGGRFVVRTNSFGMREDAEPLAGKPDWRLIVTGASNVDCACPNELSATNLLEARLRESLPGKEVEALNLGTGGYSLYHTLAVLETYRGMQPDVFLLIAYGGNDFFGCVRLERYFDRRSFPREGPYTSDGLEEQDPFTRMIGGTEISQVTYFLNNPDDVDVAVSAGCSATAEMERICREARIRFVCAYLPPPLRGQPELLAEVRATVTRLLRITDDDIAISDRLADRWLAFLAERKIAHVDLRSLFRESKERLYWSTDTHVNLLGQRVIADAVFPLVR